LDSIGVLPEFRRCGIGGRLLAAMRDKAFAEGYERVGLLVDVENPDAERLYFALGFEEVGSKTFFGHRMRHLQQVAGE
ncbi:MAG: GNAT family N-acetyltransferase, partial [Rikenella sp.]|nr:GNAT family N-acetyltransferase [Rikenella sp.]